MTYKFKFQITEKVPKKRLLSLASLAVILFFHQMSFALNVCLYARAGNNPTEGHSFVTVENDQYTVLESYGYWPRDKYPDSFAFNFKGDTPVRIIEQVWGKEAREATLPESRICQSVPHLTIEQIRATAYSYKERYGEYRFLTNNCSHFAIWLYNGTTRDTLPRSMTPSGIKQSIKKVYLSKVRSYSEYRNLNK